MSQMPHWVYATAFPDTPGTELSIIAEYKMPWDGNAQAEMNAAANGGCHAGSVNFKAVANTPNQGAHRTVIEPASDVDTLIGAILKQRDNSLVRLNIFTHGNPGLISLKGMYEAATDTIKMKRAANNQEGNPIAGGLDSDVIYWFDTNPTGKAYRSQIRDKFRAGGEILLFLCSGGCGKGKSLVIDISRCFNVAVRGYVEEIGYYIDGSVSKIDRNLTSKGRIDDAHYAAACGDGTIRPGYPCAVKIPDNIPNGSHVMPDVFQPKPKTPMP